MYDVTIKADGLSFSDLQSTASEILIRHPKTIITSFLLFLSFSLSLSLQLHSPDVVTGVVLRFSRVHVQLTPDG